MPRPASRIVAGAFPSEGRRPPPYLTRRRNPVAAASDTLPGGKFTDGWYPRKGARQAGCNPNN